MCVLDCTKIKYERKKRERENTKDYGRVRGDGTEELPRREHGEGTCCAGHGTT